MLSVANYNMHCGMDGWGRPYDYLASISSLSADVIVLEEAWTPEGTTEGQAQEAARALGYQILAHNTGQGRRIRPQPEADDRWAARGSAFADNHRALYMDGLRPQPESVQTMARWQEAEPGSMGPAVLVRPSLPIESTRVVRMSHLRSDRVRRVALVVDLTVEGRPLSVIGTHMSHLMFGSHRNYAELRRELKTAARPDALLVGDMNAWGPLVRVFMPGWRRAVIGRTWPTWRPHSQIDHILVHGTSLRPRKGTVLPHAGSDHRPVRAELDVVPVPVSRSAPRG